MKVLEIQRQAIVDRIEWLRKHEATDPSFAGRIAAMEDTFFVFDQTLTGMIAESGRQSDAELAAWKKGMTDAVMIADNPLVHIPQGNRSPAHLVNVVNAILIVRDKVTVWNEAKTE